MKLMYFAAVLAALGVPASAQVVTSPTKIVDSNNDGIIKLEAMASKVTPPVKKGTTVAVCTDAVPFTYAVKGTPCPTVDPTPPVVVPPVIEPPVVTPTPDPVPTARIVVSGLERYLVSDEMTFGLNPSATLGTFKPAPAGVPTFRSGGLLRAGMHEHASNFEYTMHGRAIEGFNVAYYIGSVRYKASNQPLTGFAEIVGAFDASALWTGQTKTGLKVEQNATIVGKAIRYDIKLTNTTSQRMTGLRYMRVADFDMDDDSVVDRDKNAFPTDNSIPSRGTVLAGLRGVGRGKVAFVSSDHPNAVATFFGFVNSDPYAPAAYDSPQAVGSTKTADVTSNVTIGLGDLPPGGSTSFSVMVGIQ